MIRDRLLLENDRALSVLLDYVILVGIFSVFMYMVISQLNGLFIENPTKIAMKNQFEDVGNQIATKLVDVALIAPKNGGVRVKLHMPHSVGEYDFEAGFVERNGEHFVKVMSEDFNWSEWIPLSNIPLEVLLEGYTYSFSPEHELTFTSTSHVKPTSVAIAYPTTVEAGGNVTFDMTYSTGDVITWFTWEFGDGDSYTGNYTASNPDVALVEHRYTAQGNYTANLTVWDSLGYSDTDSINITVYSSPPDPFMYADKFVVPETASPNEDIRITLYIKGGGTVEEARNVSVMHVIDCSGSMDPDHYGNNGYVFYNLTAAGSVSPSKWDGSVTVDNWQKMVVDAFSTGKDVDLWVKSPDGDFARAQYFISNLERYYVSDPTSGDWNITVVADYPTGSDSVTVRIWRYQGAWSVYATYNFLLSGNAFSIPVTVPSVENFKIGVSPVNGTKTLHLFVDNGALQGPYSASSGYEEENTTGGIYTAYVAADFPYGNQEFELKTYIAKIDAARTAAKIFNGFLRDDDVVGVAYFKGIGAAGNISDARVTQTLTSDIDAANLSIEGLTAYGGTPIGDGIYVAQKELEANTPFNSTPVIVLLSDGNPTIPSNALELAINNATAAKNTVVNGQENIVIYTIGFGSDANETLLEQIATSPSYYYYAATANELSAIYGQILREVKNKAGTNVTVTDVLPENVQLSSTPEGADITYIDGNTVLQWTNPVVRINETWTVSFYVKPKTEGIVQTNVYGLSNITYLEYPFNESALFRTMVFPLCEVRVGKFGTERAGLR